MIGIDTNLLVRYLTLDDPVQSDRAVAIFEKELSENNPGFVSVIAMVETVWVLDRAYDLPREKIAAAIENILQSSVLIIENEQEIFSAMIALKEGQGSFADALIAALGAKAGYSHTLTFDREALKLPGFAPA